ncbi:hypothetical protein G6F55_013988 [Rhizopus delemar]|nr:hypothetical protein G6F40_016122 [Rhizopus arrhizus]KAG1438169.1 hypothetical protein G6F55_013988 [Rhizopus delemar]
MKASLIWPSAAIARPVIGITPLSASRSLQSFSLTKAMPAFCPMPAKLKPCTENTDSTASFSFCRKWFSSAVIDSSVRSWVAPTGACTSAISTPWSSLGRNELGRRTNSTPISTNSAATMPMKRHGRWMMPRTPRW